MPTDLNIVVLKLADIDNTNTADLYARQLQFTKEFTVRKDVVLTQLRFLKANHPRYRDVQIDNQIDLPYNSNIIDNVTNSQYRDTRPSRGSVSNQRPRTQPEANPANSIETDVGASLYDDTDDDTDTGFDSSTVPALDVDRDINDLRRQVGTRPLGRRQP